MKKVNTFLLEPGPGFLYMLLQGLKVFSAPGTMPSFTCWVLQWYLFWQL